MTSKNFGPQYNKDGSLTRIPSSFRNFVSRDPNSEFPAEAGRYAIYMSPGCPWAHRSLIARQLKGLEGLIDVFKLHHVPGPESWHFTGEDGSLPKDPLHGYKLLKELYLHANPEYTGRYTVPVLWDKKKDTIVSNESSEIIRMFYTEFDHLLPEKLRESSKPGGGLLPEHQRSEIDDLNDWVYHTISNGVYMAGFSKTQEGYNDSVQKVFASLDRLEDILGHGKPYLFGDHITDADIRLYTSLIRFDVAYHTIFACNLKSIRHDYPRLHRWLRVLYWDRDENGEARAAFYDTTEPEISKYAEGYAVSKRKVVLGEGTPLIVPAGPKIPVEPLPRD